MIKWERSLLVAYGVKILSYDLMVFDPAIAPNQPEAFLEWYGQQTKWGELHNYQDHAITTPKLRDFFLDIIKKFPPMNGPLRSDDFDDLRVSDYSIGLSIIYIAFAWSVAEDAYSTVRQLAAEHKIGFFDVSGNSEITLPLA